MKKRTLTDIEKLCARLAGPGFTFVMEDYYALKDGLPEMLNFFKKTVSQIRIESEDNRQRRLF